MVCGRGDSDVWYVGSGESLVTVMCMWGGVRAMCGMWGEVRVVSHWGVKIAVSHWRVKISGESLGG